MTCVDKNGEEEKGCLQMTMQLVGRDTLWRFLRKRLFRSRFLASSHLAPPVQRQRVGSELRGEPPRRAPEEGARERERRKKKRYSSARTPLPFQWNINKNCLPRYRKPKLCRCARLFATACYFRHFTSRRRRR